jgi:hypothetical protein
MESLLVGVVILFCVAEAGFLFTVSFNAEEREERRVHRHWLKSHFHLR